MLAARRRIVVLACSLLGVTGVTREALAQSPPVPPSSASPPPAPNAPVRAIAPEQVQGTLRPVIEPTDAARGLAEAIAIVPRKAVELLFLASGIAAGIFRDQQVVPRVAELMSPRAGQLAIFPMVFAGNRRAPSLGVRMLSSSNVGATAFAFGIGGVRDVNVEGRVRVASATPVPLVLALEGLYDVRSHLKYLGVGQEPERDRRNQFRTGIPANVTCSTNPFEKLVAGEGAPREATYMERRSRSIASLGLRLANDVEMFVSSGLTLSHVDDTPGSGCSALSQVFAPGSVPGASGQTRVLYTEMALRLDTRPTLGRPSSGVLLELYAGRSQQLSDVAPSFFRAGANAGVYFPLFRKANILSPRLAVDGLASPPGLPLPFTELVGQPQFRGFDTRRDRFSVVGSLDYRWTLVRYVAARLFGDFATVGPDLKSMFALPPRWAAGFGFDLFTNSTELGQFALAYSPDGIQFLLSFGISTLFGDRQHRN